MLFLSLQSTCKLVGSGYFSNMYRPGRLWLVRSGLAPRSDMRRWYLGSGSESLEAWTGSFSI